MCPYIPTASSNHALLPNKLLLLTNMDHPLRHFSARIPSIPGHPLYCPKCLAIIRFHNEEERDMHYLQLHVLRVSEGNAPSDLTMIDDGNYDGPLGKKQHVFPESEYCQEPESYLTEKEKTLDEQNVRRWQGKLGVHSEDEVAREDIKC
jgi:hypothetical protein